MARTKFAGPTYLTGKRALELTPHIAAYTAYLTADQPANLMGLVRRGLTGEQPGGFGPTQRPPRAKVADAAPALCAPSLLSAGQIDQRQDPPQIIELALAEVLEHAVEHQRDDIPSALVATEVEFLLGRQPIPESADSLHSRRAGGSPAVVPSRVRTRAGYWWSARLVSRLQVPGGDDHDDEPGDHHRAHHRQRDSELDCDAASQHPEPSQLGSAVSPTGMTRKRVECVGLTPASHGAVVIRSGPAVSPST